MTIKNSFHNRNIQKQKFLLICSRFDDQHSAQEVFHEAGGGGRGDAVLVSKRVSRVRAERVRDGLDKFSARIRARPDFHHLQHEFQRVLREEEGAGT